MSTKVPFERVVAEHRQTVLRVCRVVVGVDGEEDAWSETFLAALRAYPELPADANVEAWLVTIAHRKALDIIRARRRNPGTLEELPEMVSTVGIPGSVDHELWDSVRRLPPRQREAVAYHYVAGLPYQDIAEILGGTAEAARKAASDGIKTLRLSYPSAYEKGSIE
jgi:RNA polymerase sigma factor (sigma-70 family)